MKLALYNLTTTVKTGGVETVYWEVARELCLRGHEVVIMGGQGEVLPPFNSPQMTVRQYPFIPRDRFRNFGTRYCKMRERQSFGRFAKADLVAGRFVVILIGKPYDLGLALGAGRKSGAKVAFMSGGTEFIPGYNRAVKRLDYFCSVSAYVSGLIERRCGRRPEVNYNGVDLTTFHPRPPEMDMARRLGLKSDRALMVSACRLIGWKGVHRAVEAVAQLKNQGRRDLCYVIAGDGPEKERLVEMTERLGVNDVVVFAGWMAPSDLAALYSMARVGVFPSLADEAFGISCAEAMAMEVPVVTTRVGGIPEVVGNDEGGILCQPDDPVGLSVALGRLIDNQELARDLGRAGRKRVERNFTWKRWADQFLAAVGG